MLFENLDKLGDNQIARAKIDGELAEELRQSASLLI